MGMNRKQRRANHKAGQVAAATAAAGDAVTLHAMGVEAFRAGQLQAGAELIRQAIAANGQMPDFHYNLGIVLRAQDKLTEAAASYHRAIELKPDYGNAHNNLGNVWKALGEMNKARACFERAMGCNPGGADSYYNLGILSNDDGDRAAAARYFQKCLECDPQDARGVQVLRAHLGKASAPPQTSHAHILKLYDVRSRF